MTIVIYSIIDMTKKKMIIRISINAGLYLLIRVRMNNDKLTADLTSYTCQFCGASFGRGTELSLHYKEKHPEDVGRVGN